jgi:hypothetical protein
MVIERTLINQDGSVSAEEITVADDFFTAGQAAGEIADLKSKLAATDYLAIKYAEGCLTEAEYAETKAQRQAWREQINALEGTS